MAKSSRNTKVVNLRPAATEVPAAVPGCLGTLTGVSKDGQLIVDYPGNPFGSLPATSLVRLTADEALAMSASRQPVMLSFDGGQPDRPVVMGVVQHPAVTAQPESQEVVGRGLRAIVDGREVVLNGSERVELRCGKASIILTRAGKVIIRGEYISSRSTGAHRIRGGSVSLN